MSIILVVRRVHENQNAIIREKLSRKRDKGN